MRLNRSLLSPILVAISIVPALAAASWGFRDATVSIQGPGSEDGAGRVQEKCAGRHVCPLQDNGS